MRKSDDAIPLSSSSVLGDALCLYTESDASERVNCSVAVSKLCRSSKLDRKPSGSGDSPGEKAPSGGICGGRAGKLLSNTFAD